MKLLSFRKKDRTKSYGIHNGQGIIDLGSRFAGKYADLKALLGDEDGMRAAAAFAGADADVDVASVAFLPVIEKPSKILCVGMNYADKRVEFGETNPAPTLFIRFPDSQTGHESPVMKPAFSNEFDYEGELAVVIGKRGLHIQEQQALSHVAGYSCYMDGSVRDWQHTWYTAGKNWANTGAFGPWLVTGDEIPDPSNLRLNTYLNGQMMQDDTTANLIHSIPQLIAYISTFTELSPGDVIITGSPGGVGKKRNPPVFMKEGDLIEVEIEKIGRLRNRIVDTRIDAANMPQPLLAQAV